MAKKDIFRCDRRALLKWMGIGAVGTFINFDNMAYAGECTKISANESLPFENPSVTGEELMYWIDGASGGEYKVGVDTVHRHKIALHIEKPQSDKKYVESVILADAQDRVVASQVLNPLQRTTFGYSPYVIFDNIILDVTKALQVYYIYRDLDDNSSEVFRFTIAADKIRQSRLDYKHLSAEAQRKIPKSFVDEMNNSSHSFNSVGVDPNDAASVAANGPQGNFGYMTTPFQHYAPLNLHRVRARLMDLKDNGAAAADFKFQIFEMHADFSSDAHYMRYFLVLDPVGRVLGGLRRTFDLRTSEHKGTPVTGAGNYHVIERRLDGEFDGIGTDPNNLNILDCPYVQIITEDKQDAIARMTVRIR